jgi:hypothetical protein
MPLLIVRPTLSLCGFKGQAESNYPPGELAARFKQVGLAASRSIKDLRFYRDHFNFTHRVATPAEDQSTES